MASASGTVLSTCRCEEEVMFKLTQRGSSPGDEGGRGHAENLVPHV